MRLISQTFLTLSTVANIRGLKSIARTIVPMAFVMIALIPADRAAASDRTCIGAIDAIDIVFPAGGGTFNGNFSSGNDDDWIVFGANAGDLLVLTGASPGFTNGVLVEDIDDGNIQVGDAVGICNFNNNNIGLGFPLRILTTNTAWGFNSNAFGGGFGLGTLTFVAPFTGQYALALAVNNSGSNTVPGPYTVTLSGNTGVVGVITVDIDIKFCSDPNAFNCRKKGVLPVTIFGTASFDPLDIDPSTLRLCRDDTGACTAGAPIDFSIADRGDPTSDLGASMCAIDPATGLELHSLNPDGFLDFDAAFDATEVQTLLGDFCGGMKNEVSSTLVITGSTFGGIPISSAPVNNTGIDQLVKKGK